MLKSLILSEDDSYNIVTVNAETLKKTIFNLNNFDKENILSGTKLKRLISGKTCCGLIDMKVGDIVKLDFIGESIHDHGWVYLKECSDINFNGEWNPSAFDIYSDLEVLETPLLPNLTIDESLLEIIKKVFFLYNENNDIIFSKEISGFRTHISNNIELLRKEMFYLKKEIIKSQIYKQYTFSKIGVLISEDDFKKAYFNYTGKVFKEKKQNEKSFLYRLFH